MLVGWLQRHASKSRRVVCPLSACETKWAWSGVVELLGLRTITTIMPFANHSDSKPV